MAELSGSLASFGVAPIAQLLATMGQTGDLHLSCGPWAGQLSVERGRVIDARVEEETGLNALELIATGMRDGQFKFSEGPPSSSAESADTLGPDALAQLVRLADGPPATWALQVPSVTAVPRALISAEFEETEVALARGTISVLLCADGRQTVREIATRYGLLRTLKALGLLYERGLVSFEAGGPTSALRPQGPGHTPTLRSSGPRLGEWLAGVRGGVAHRRVLGLGTELVQALVFAAALTLGARAVVQNFRVEGISMQPNFAGGQVLVVNRAAYFHLDGGPLAAILPTTRQGTTKFLFGGPQRGDVAVFRAPPQPDLDYIKRIIGLPGDHIAVQNGRVFVNGALLVEPYIQFTAAYNFPTDGTQLVVPDASYFVLGDNRPESLDSHFGWFVPVESLIGRAWIRYWPPNALGVVQTVRPAEDTTQVAHQANPSSP